MRERGGKKDECNGDNDRTQQGNRPGPILPRAPPPPLHGTWWWRKSWASQPLCWKKKAITTAASGTLQAPATRKWSTATLAKASAAVESTFQT